MENSTFVDGEDIPLVHQGDDCYDYETPNTSKVETSIDETSFTVPSTQEEATSTLRVRQKVKRGKN